MTYYDMLNSFYDLLQSNPLSSSAQLLYYTLLQINNKCGWIEWFQRTNINICGLTRINEKTLISSRNELKQVGLIDFIPSKKKGEITKYKILGCKIDSSNYSINKIGCKIDGSNDSVIDSLIDSLTTVESTVEPTDIKDLDIDLAKDKDKDKNIFVTTDVVTTNANLDKNKKTNKPSKEKPVAKEFDVEGIEYKSSRYLADEILKVNPNAKVPKTDKELFKWCIYIDYILRFDNKPVEEFKKVLAFAVKNNFWSTVILSTQKFRAKYDQIFMQMQKQDKGGNSSESNNTSKPASKASYGTIL